MRIRSLPISLEKVRGYGVPEVSTTRYVRQGYSDLGQSLNYAGYHHFCLTVTSIDATVRELRRRGVTIVTEPFVLDVISRKLAFFADPWGNLIELAEILG